MLSGMGTKLSTFSLMAFSLSVFNFAQAKSVYVITDHHGNTVKAYKIQGNQFEYQTDAKDLPNHGNGPVGIDIDPDSEFLFITYEDSDKITLLNAKTMIAEQDPVAAPGATDLAGLVFDSTKQKLYTVKRQDNRLYAYLWDANTKILTLEGGTYKTLENIGTYPNGAYGLTLDPESETLCVTYDGSDKLVLVDAKTMQQTKFISTSAELCGIAFDQAKQKFYTTNYSNGMISRDV